MYLSITAYVVLRSNKGLCQFSWDDSNTKKLSWRDESFCHLESFLKTTASLSNLILLVSNWDASCMLRYFLSGYQALSTQRKKLQSLDFPDLFQARRLPIECPAKKFRVDTENTRCTWAGGTFLRQRKKSFSSPRTASVFGDGHVMCHSVSFLFVAGNSFWCVAYELQVQWKMGHRNRYLEWRDDGQMNPRGCSNFNSYVKNLLLFVFITDGLKEKLIRGGWVTYRFLQVNFGPKTSDLGHIHFLSGTSPC